MLALPYLSCCCLNLQIVTFETVLDIYSLSTGSGYVYTVTFFLPPKGSDDLRRLTTSWQYWFLVNGSCYLPFHRGCGSLTGATHLTSQCNKAFVVKRILDLLQEKCALKKDERTTQTEEHFLRYLGSIAQGELSGASLCTRKAILVSGTGFHDSHTFS